MTPTHTQPVPAVVAATPRKSITTYAIAGAALVAVAALFVWKPWAGSGGRALDANVVAVLPFRVAGADPSVQYLRQGMVDLLQAKLTGEGGPRAADTRSVLAAVRDAGGSDTDDLPVDAVAGVARKIGAGRVLQGSIVGPPDHLVISASLVEMPGGRTVAQTTVDGPKDSLFVLVDRLTAQLLALGAGATPNAAERPHHDQPRRPPRLPRRRDRLSPRRVRNGPLRCSSAPSSSIRPLRWRSPR